MPHYIKLGKIPQKRHTQFRKPEGTLYSEQVVGTKGFSGISSILYHINPPTKVEKISTVTPIKLEEWNSNSLRHFHFKTLGVKPNGDYISGREVLMFNNDVSLAICNPVEQMNYLYKNGEGDELVFVHEGKGTMESIYGSLEYHEGDYIIIPRNVIHRFVLKSDKSRFLVIESASPIETPHRYRNEYGQLLEHAPFCERDFRVPENLLTIDEKGEFEVKIKKSNCLNSYIYGYHPFDVVGWDGYFYPWIFNINDFMPITGKIHQPPPVHQTFEGFNFVVCSFCPRLFDYHPESVPVPYNHSNIDSDEVLYYVEGNFMSRKGIDVASFTLHPAGIPHGPHPGTVEASLGKKETLELAVMLDTFHPLKLTSFAKQYDEPKYPYSWNEEGHQAENRMNLSEETKQKIHHAHFVNGREPGDYLVDYKNFFDLLQHRVNLHPDQPFIVYYDDNEKRIQLSYKEFTEKVFKTANLLSQNGIETEDRIATVSYNHINTVIQYFAAWSLGATVVPINVNEEAERIKYILKSSNTRLAFVNYDYLDRICALRDELSNLEKIFVYGLDNYRTESSAIEKLYTALVYEDELEKYGASFIHDKKVNLETEALIVYTSGTTGLPKGVVLTQYNLLADAEGITKWHELKRGDRMMCVLPIHHVNGTVVTLITPMYYGGATILNQRFHTRKFFQRLANEKIQVVSVVPTLLQFLCHDYETSGDTDFFHAFEDQLASTFEHIICGAGPLTCELVTKFENIFNLKIVHGYGLSETTCYSCFIPIGLPEKEHNQWLNEFGFPSIGVPIEPNEMDIHDEFGNSVGEDKRGEIVIRGHNVMKYYMSPPLAKGGQGGSESDTNSKTFEFGWFRSGDEGFYKLGETGNKYFFITGRIKELIIRGGVNIAPLEIDEVLMSLPMVKAGIAVGFDNDWYGEEVGALVLLKDGLYNPDSEISIKNEIISRCKEKLPYYKTPKTVVFTDTIPVTSTGKYQRNKVKHLFVEFKQTQFRD